MKPFATLVLALLTLTACKAEPSKSAGGTARGEVLPGSASDAMLPLDTLKSQAPLAPKSEGEDKADAKSGSKATGKPKDTSKPTDEPPTAEAADPVPAEEQ